MGTTLKSSRQLSRKVHLLSAPESSSKWALGMRAEIQATMNQSEVDMAYAGECLGSLLRSRGWRRLRNAQGAPFRSFIEFCRSARPQGLGLDQSDLETLIQ